MSETPTVETTMVCAVCAREQRAPSATRPPRGWKRIHEALYCRSCVSAAYVLRAVTVPIAAPVGSAWAAFGAACRAAWAETTRAANWLATELYARDVRREPSDAALRPMPRIYLYPEARVLFPGISPIHLSALINQVEQTYRRRRYELLWQRAISLPTYRYPVPAPIHRQGWRLEHVEGGAIHAHVRLGDRWWTLRLRGGHHFARQRGALLDLIAGTALPGAGALQQVSASAGDHRHAERGTRIMLKLVGRFPRRPRVPGAASCEIATATSDLWILRLGDRGNVGRVSGDTMRRGIRAYTVQRERIAQELSLVRGVDPRARAGMLARLERMAARHRDQQRTWCQQVASQAAEQARRAGASVVTYRDVARGWCDPCPWARLRQALEQACEARGMGFVVAASGAEPSNEAEALAERGSREES